MLLKKILEVTNVTMSIHCGRFCSTLAYGLWSTQMFMQYVRNVRSFFLFLFK